MQISIKPKGDSSPSQNQLPKVVNILPITQAKNKDFLKIILKRYPESFRNWVLKTYPREKRGLESPCQVYDIQSWREKAKKLATNVVIGISAIIGSMFFNAIFLTWILTDESEQFTTFSDVMWLFGN